MIEDSNTPQWERNWFPTPGVGVPAIKARTSDRNSVARSLPLQEDTWIYRFQLTQR
jgi:hypothetical protein